MLCCDCRRYGARLTHAPPEQRPPGEKRERSDGQHSSISELVGNHLCYDCHDETEQAGQQPAREWAGKTLPGHQSAAKRAHSKKNHAAGDLNHHFRKRAKQLNTPGCQRARRDPNNRLGHI